jgi:hypothetical protein
LGLSSCASLPARGIESPQLNFDIKEPFFATGISWQIRVALTSVFGKTGHPSEEANKRLPSLAQLYLKQIPAHFIVIIGWICDTQRYKMLARH